MQSYYTGLVGFDIATIYVVLAKVGKAAVIVETLDQFDIFSQVISKLMKATGSVIKVTAKTIKVSAQSGYEFVRVLSKSGNLYCSILAPIADGDAVSKAYKAAVAKFEEKWTKGLVKAEEIIIKGADGNDLLDELGRKIGYVEQDGQRIIVLLDESFDNLPGRVSDDVSKSYIWKKLPYGGISQIEDLLLGSGEVIQYKSVRYTKLSIEDQINILINNVTGLTNEQAEFLIKEIQKTEGRIVFGGSRVRGNASSISDLDVGFDGISQSRLYKIANAYNKKFFGSSQYKGVGAIQDQFILPGSNVGGSVIKSPEEFFMRSGIRHLGDGVKGGEPYLPSGFISVDKIGNVHLGMP